LAETLTTVIKFIIGIGLFVGMFCISVSTGFAAIGFYVLGFLLGYYNKRHKQTKVLLEKMVEHKEDFLAGKHITLSLDLDNDKPEVSVMIETKEEVKKEVVEEPVKKEKKKKKTVC
jgi:hypothetical protein